jgi:signal transduction histidine kinase
LLGKSAFNFVHQDDLAIVMSEFSELLNDEETNLGAVHRFLTKDGSWVWLESRGVNHLPDPVINGLIINAREITDRIKLQQELDEELANRQLMITKAAIMAQEKERSQVGLELHDNVNQVLTTVKLYQELCLSGIGNREELIRKSMDLLQVSINEIRSLSKRLSAPTLGKIKLHDSVKELLDVVSATGKIRINFQEEKMANREVEPELHLALYRILQEHLTNVLKHAKASLVEVKLSCKNQFLTMQITDDGVGFDPAIKSKGIGITNMRTRAESLGGTFVITSKPGNGASLMVKFSTALHDGQQPAVIFHHSVVDE